MTISKTKRIAAFLTAMITMLALSAFFCFENAYAEISGKWEYEEVNGGAKIIGYLGNTTSVTVPSKLDNGLLVNSVAGLGISASKKLESVTFSSGIKKIESSAFKNYQKLSKVVFSGSSIQTIEAGAFEGCAALTSISLPSTVTTLGEGVFMNCTGLTGVRMVCKVKTIPSRTFFGCTALNSVTLPNYATEIGDNVFVGCTALTSVSLPDTLKSIGANTFSGCTSLISPTFPGSLTDIGAFAYKDCKTISNVFIPNTVKSIGEGAFSGCSTLEAAYLSPSVQKLGMSAFANCKKLKKIVFGGDYYGFKDFLDNGFFPEIYYPGYKTSWNNFDYKAKKSFTTYAAAPTKTTLALNLNKGETIKVTVSPNVDALKEAYIFTSENPAVATVSAKGYVQAKLPGITKINITTVTGTSKSVTVKVYPAAPSNLKATPKSTASISLKWAAGKASGYEVYRATSKNGTYKKIATVTSAEYTDKGLTKGTTYYYKVRAYTLSSSKIYSSYSSVVSAAATSPAPTTLTVTKASSGAANIKWTKSTGANGYEVYMAKSKTGTYTKIYTATKPTTFSCKKTGLTGGKTYYFKVRSYVTVNGKKVYSPYTTVKSVKV